MVVQALSSSCLPEGKGTTTLSEQDESAFEVFKDATVKQNYGKDRNDQTQGACGNGQVLQSNSDALKLVLIHRRLRFSCEVNKRIPNCSKHLSIKASVSFPFGFFPKTEGWEVGQSLLPDTQVNNSSNRHLKIIKKKLENAQELYVLLSGP